MLQTRSISETRAAPAAAIDRTAAAWPAVAAALLGFFILFGVAFAGPNVIHNAAHDSRHAHTFPCH